MPNTKKVTTKKEIKVNTKKVVTKVKAVKSVSSKKTPTSVKTTPVLKVAKYVNKNIQISPRKLRLLVNRIRPLSPTLALERLNFVNTKAARILTKALKNIIADAKNNFNLDVETLKFDTIKADEAMKLKRMDKSHGSHFARGIIQKRHSRLLIKVQGVQK